MATCMTHRGDMTEGCSGNGNGGGPGGIQGYVYKFDGTNLIQTTDDPVTDSVSDMVVVMLCTTPPPATITDLGTWNTLYPATLAECAAVPGALSLSADNNGDGTNEVIDLTNIAGSEDQRLAFSQGAGVGATPDVAVCSDAAGTVVIVGKSVTIG